MARFDKLEFNSSEKPREDDDESKQADFDENYWMQQADENRRAGHYENALKFYSRALEKDRSLIAGWVGQVQMLVFLDELPEAELWGRKALELFPSQGELLAGRAQAFCRIGDMKQAYELCDGSFQQSGQSAYRWTVRGEIMTSTGQDKEAYCFDKAQEADSDWLVPLEIALIYLYYKKPGKALSRARRAVESASESYNTWYVQGCCQAKLGFISQARQSFRHCLELCPRHVEAGSKLIQLDRRIWSPLGMLRRLFKRY
jgi:tetratricopeptide (TPR) repeat protein